MGGGKVSGVYVAVLLLVLMGCGLGTDTPVAPTRTMQPSPLATPVVATALPTVPLAPVVADATATVTSTQVLTGTTVATATLTLWTTEQGVALQLVRTLAAEFSSQAGVQVTVVPRSSENLRVDLIATLLTQRAGPDMLWGNQDDLAELLTDGQLQPVGQAAGARHFIPAAITSASLDGQLWGTPIMAEDFLLLFYNRALVQQPPVTTDELIALARGFQDASVYGLVAGWTEARWLLAWLNGSGGALTTPDGLQPTLDTPQMISALNLLLELHRGAPDTSYTAGRDMFAAGQVALTLDGDWALPTYRAPGAALDLGVAPPPRIPATGRLAVSAPSITYLMLPRTLTDEKLTLARGFASFLATSEVQVRLANALTRLPTLQVALAELAITSDAVLAAVAVQANDAPGLPPTRALRCAVWGVESQLGGLLAEEFDQQQAAAAMQQTATACLAQ